MNCKILIGNYEFVHCSSFECNSSWKTLADTAKILLPNVKSILSKELKRGMPVEIWAGYDGNLTQEFKGYVSKITASSPVEIECEDEMWKLKQEEVSKSWRSVDLSAMLRDILPGAKINSPNVNLSPFRVDKLTKAKVLEKIKDEFGLIAYFRGKTLHVGFPYFETGLGSVGYHFQKNIPSGGVDNLSFSFKDDVKVKVKAISVMPDNKKITVDVGDKDGEVHTLHFYNKSKSEIEKLAQKNIEKFKYDGYKGSFISFGEPFASHSMIAVVWDDKYPERAGRYFIDSVNVSYGPNGYRREIELGKKASS
jgi:hypothetical protein